MRTDPRPTPEAMGAYYPDDYGPYASSRIPLVAKAHGQARRILDSMLRWVFQFNTHVLPDMKPGRMLEVGCASGSFLAQMASAGWRVAGIEISRKAGAAAHAAGFEVFAGTVDEAPEPPRKYDLIVAWMVIEHLHDPLVSLSTLSRWTRPGGWLAISVPDASALEFRLFKDAGYALHLPNHLYHFTPKTVNILLQRSGWRVEKIVHHRVLNNLMGSLGYKLDDWRAPAWLVRMFSRYPQQAGRWALIFYPVAWLLAALRQTGRMTILARRAEEVR